VLNPSEAENQPFDEMDPGSGMWVVCSTHHTGFQSTQGQSIFEQGMIQVAAHITDWQHAKGHKQTLMNENNQRQNDGQIDHDCAFGGDSIMKTKAGLLKMEQPKENATSMSFACMQMAV
jgi:hypothetical protein